MQNLHHCLHTYVHPAKSFQSSREGGGGGGGGGVSESSEGGLAMI